MVPIVELHNVARVKEETHHFPKTIAHHEFYVTERTYYTNKGEAILLKLFHEEPQIATQAE